MIYLQCDGEMVPFEDTNLGQALVYATDVGYSDAVFGILLGIVGGEMRISAVTDNTERNTPDLTARADQLKAGWSDALVTTIQWLHKRNPEEDGEMPREVAESIADGVREVWGIWHESIPNDALNKLYRAWGWMDPLPDDVER